MVLVTTVVRKGCFEAHEPGDRRVGGVGEWLLRPPTPMTMPTGSGRQPGLVVEEDVERVGLRRRADATLGNSGRRRELIMVETRATCARHVLGWVGRCGGGVEELQPAGDLESNVNKVNGGG